MDDNSGCQIINKEVVELCCDENQSNEIYDIFHTLSLRRDFLLVNKIIDVGYIVKFHNTYCLMTKGGKLLACVFGCTFYTREV